MIGVTEQDREDVVSWLCELQSRICATFEDIENELGSPAQFERKKWDRPGGGGGEMSIMRGEVFEKVGVNVSTVFGSVSEDMGKLIANFGNNFWASGISLVAHMKSPVVPSVHMNTRLICSEARHWFGGGADLTPTIVYDEDTNDFHTALRGACDSYHPDAYKKYKEECDEYFFIKHRGEPRGVGGIFYDYLCGPSFEKDFDFMKGVGLSFLEIYPKLVRRRMAQPWTKEDKMAQLLKRGRYAEFNLMYDRGTRFGLITGANPEAFLMSLPPEAAWS